ncbi:serine/threonine protein kinase [Hokovirus HKV1]|uniref:Serine/threonine protein kinase n=1 Tax=Hokovirus HKV1 TaxID=1977638 RepID=A0A1V0SGY7_9VIRU|nr:serine/threonine protein kinase [Hokovirus HKV1]
MGNNYSQFNGSLYNYNGNLVEDNILDNFKITSNILGTGSSSTIFEGSFFDNKIAVKRVNKSEEETVISEYHITRSLNHDKIVKTCGLFYDDKYYYLLLEYINGITLLDYLVDNYDKFTLINKLKIINQLLNIIKYLHDSNIVHRDIKLENIMLNENTFDVKLIDFNFATVTTNILLTKYCGSMLYAAPEIIDHLPYLGKPSDIWSLGVIIYMLFKGKPLFGDDSKTHASLICNKIPIDYTNLSVDCINFLNCMLKYEPDKRKNIDEIIIEFDIFDKLCLKDIISQTTTNQ